MKLSVISFIIVTIMMFVVVGCHQEQETDWDELQPISEEFRDDAVRIMRKLEHQYKRGSRDDSIITIYDDFRKFEDKYLTDLLTNETEHTILMGIQDAYKVLKKYQYTPVPEMVDEWANLLEEYIELMNDILENVRVR